MLFLSHRLFSFPFFSTAPSLFLSIFPRKLRGNRQIFGSEPSLRLIWAQNQPNFRPNRQNAGNFAENPCIPGNYPATAWVFCRFPFSSILPQILPQTSSQTQGNTRVSRMEHQTPSVFPGNFRKRKVLGGDLCFPFCLPEKYIQAKQGLGPAIGGRCVVLTPQ